VESGAVMNMSRRRTLFIVILLAVAISAVVVVVIGIRKEPGKELLKIMSDRVDLQVRNIHYTEVGDSGMKWEITADAARYQKKENLALFDKLAVKLFTKDGKTFVMTGDHGRLNTESRAMEIDGNVGIVSENGDRFATDRLRYRNADKVIETDRPVAMENVRFHVSGVGMVVSLEEKKVAILSEVRARLAGGIGEQK
jgi:LPS export ABC transporter protein LptC